MKYALLLLSLFLVTPAMAKMTPAQKTYQQTLKSIIKDVYSDIRRRSEDYQHFETSVLLDSDVPNDALNKLVNKLIKDGYEVRLDFLFAEEDAFEGTRINIRWATPPVEPKREGHDQWLR